MAKLSSSEAAGVVTHSRRPHSFWRAAKGTSRGAIAGEVEDAIVSRRASGWRKHASISVGEAVVEADSEAKRWMPAASNFARTPW